MATVAHVFSEIWSFLGAELVIFATTVVFALLFQTATRNIKKHNLKSLGDAKGRVIRGKTQAPIKAPYPRASVRGACTECAPVAVHAASKMPALASQPSYSAKLTEQIPSPPGAVKIVDEIFALTRGTQTQNQATSVLQLYVELRPMLGMRSENLPAPDAGEAIVRAEMEAHFEMALLGRSGMKFYTAIINSAIRAGQCHFVEELCDDMTVLGVPRTASFYESAMKQLAGRKQHKMALNIYDRLCADGLETSVVTYSCLVFFAADVGDTARAADFFRKLQSHATPSIRAYMTMLRVFAQQSDWPQAVATLRDMQSRSVEVDNPVFNIVLSAAIGVDKAEEAEELLEEAVQSGKPSPDVVGFNTAIKGYAKRCDLQSAQRLVERMRASGLQPNAITFNTLLDAAARSSTMNYDAAWNILEDMRRTGLKPDKFTCSILVRCVSRKPISRNVLAVLMALDDAASQLDFSSLCSHYHTVLAAAAACSDDVLIVKCKAEMCKRGIQPKCVEAPPWKGKARAVQTN